MRPVERHEIIDYATYEEQRNAIREQVLKVKESRRIHVGDHLTFLFENAETVRYQVQEMMRTEKMVKESDIQHEINTYNFVEANFSRHSGWPRWRNFGPGVAGGTFKMFLNPCHHICLGARMH